MDIVKLFDYVKQGCEKINEKINGKDIVLVVGNTGSGKSTLVNYLIGHKIVFSTKNGSKIADIQNKNSSIEYAPIGHQLAVSQTLFPEAFVDKSTNIYYCDCPGFLDNRDIEEKISISINLETAIKYSKNLRAILIAINLADLNSAKGKSFIQLYTILEQLVNLEKSCQSILFIITRSSTDYKVEHFINDVKELIDDWSKKLANHTIQDKERFLKILNLILENKQNVLIGNLSDMMLRNSVVNFLKINKTVSKQYFNFGTNDDFRMKFHQHFNEIIYEALGNLKTVVEMPQEIESLNSKFNLYKLKIVYLEKKLQEKKEKQDKIIMLNDYNESLETCEKNYNNIEDELIKLKEEESKIKKEKEALTSEKEYLIKTENFEEKRLVVFGLLAFSKKLFAYSDSNTPILRVEKSCTNGEFYKENAKYDEGFYSVKYKSGLGSDGCAKVNIFIKEKHKHENQARVKYLDEHVLKDLKEKIDQIENSKNDQIKELRELNGIVKSLKSSDKNEVELNLKFKQDVLKDIQCVENSINSTSLKLKESKNYLNNAISYVKSREKFLEKIDFLIKSLKIETIASNEFVAYFNKYQNNTYNLESNLEILLENRNELVKKMKICESIISEQQSELESIKNQIKKVNEKIEKLDSSKTTQIENESEQNNNQEVQTPFPKPLQQKKGKSNFDNLVKLFNNNEFKKSEVTDVNKVNKIDSPIDQAIVDKTDISNIKLVPKLEIIQSSIYPSNETLMSQPAMPQASKASAPPPPPPPPLPLPPVSPIPILNKDVTSQSNLHDNLLNEIKKFGGNTSKLKRVEQKPNNKKNPSQNKSINTIFKEGFEAMYPNLRHN